MASACVDAPTAFQPLNFPTRQVCLKASPTFLSSDLFTPFSASPRSSITEFVRPSYGKGNTWGVVKTSYAGVGPTVGVVEESGKGSISRSHRHFGTGCVNYHAPNQPYSVTELQLSQCRPCDQLLPKPLLTQEVVLRKQKEEFPRNGAFTSHVSKFAVFPCATTKDRSSASSKEILTPRTVETLQQLHSALYCTTTYKQQHRNFFIKKPADLHQTIPTQNHKECFSIEKTNSFHVFEAGAANDSDVPHGKGEEDSTPAAEAHWGTEEGDNGPELDAELGEIDKDCLPAVQNEPEEEQGNEGAPESDFATEHDPTSYIRVTHLKELPDHFGRITSKYTRNYRCSTWPCYIPYYLHHRHSLLPSSISVLPPEYLRARSPSVCKGKDRPGSSKSETCADVADDGETSSTKVSSSPNNAGKTQSALKFGHGSTLPVNVLISSIKEQRLPSLTHTQSGFCTQAQRTGLHSNSTVHLSGEQPPTTTSNQQWKLPKIVNCGGTGLDGDGVECVEVPPLSMHLLSPSGSRVPHRLGLRFKSEAHARYHTLHPDSVPDLRDSRQSAKKHFFFGYHASVFRG